MKQQRLHKYTYTVTVFTTDGNSSPDAFAETIEALTPFSDYRHVTCELQNRATCPESRTIDVPPMPVFPSGADKRQEMAYFDRQDEWVDAVTAAVRAWQNEVPEVRP